MAEVGVTMGSWEYRMKWYGEDEGVARARAAEVGAGCGTERDAARMALRGPCGGMAANRHCEVRLACLTW